jgi:phosphatidylinositol alpha-1,6-mannosyltransferase
MTIKDQLLIIASEFPPGPGGIGQHAASFLRALPAQMSVHILANQDYCSPEQAKEYNSRELKPNHQFTPFISRNKRLYPMRRAIQAIRMVKSTCSERVIVSGQFPLWLGGLIKVLFPKRRVDAFVHGTEVTPKNNPEDRLTRWSLKKLDCIYPVSNYTKTFLPESKAAQTIRIIPNGIDAELIEIAREKPAENIELKGSPKILTVGNVTFRKGQHRIIKALPVLKKVFPDIHYHVVGLPSYKEQMESIAKENDVEDLITFHGRVSREKLYSFYRNSDIFFMLSENQANGDVEGFGIAILEANAFGLPAIGAKGCGIEDAVENGFNGYLVDGNDHDDILQAVQKCLDNHGVLSNNSIKWAQKHSWNTIVKV